MPSATNIKAAKPLRMLNFKLRWSLCCRDLLSAAENDNHELADSGHQHVNRRFPFFFISPLCLALTSIELYFSSS
jgi:hypothetical protein